MSVRKMSLSDHRGRNALVALEGCRVRQVPRYQEGTGSLVRHVRLVKTDMTTTHKALACRFGDGDELATALMDSDPEIDIESAGRETGSCKRIFVDGKGEPLYAARILAVVYSPDGSEKERRDPKSYASNLLDPRPWSGKFFPPDMAVRRFAFTRKYLVRHVDPLSFDFLHAIAKYLEERSSLLVVGSGPQGTGPLILEKNGAPMLGLLEGRTDGDGYLLVLHLAGFELRCPQEVMAS